MKAVGEILGVKFTGDESAAEIGEQTANAYRAFRDGLLDGKAVTFPLDEDNIPQLAAEVAGEAFAPLTPVPVDAALAAQMLRRIR